MTPYIGAIFPFGLYFAPLGWAYCNGQLLPINQYDALFALIGTTYGGDGQSTFALPDFRGRIPIHQGQGPGQPNYVIGQMGGSETVTLTQNQLPIHNHSFSVNGSAATIDIPQNGNSLAAPIDVNNDVAYMYNNSAAPNTALAPNSIGISGNNAPHENIMPILAMNYCISLEGIFPSRN